jgi:hypothetical protein
VKYLIMIYSNPAFLEVWQGLSDAERVELGRCHLALTDDLAASGELIVAEGLADPSLAKRVSVREGRTVTSDGPFAEVKEHLAGFYLVECDSIERAVEHAARIPRMPQAARSRYGRCWTSAGWRCEARRSRAGLEAPPTPRGVIRRGGDPGAEGSRGSWPRRSSRSDQVARSGGG